MIRTVALTCVLSISLLANEPPQQRPDFSGRWTLVESLTNSARGGSDASGGLVKTTVDTIGGAAFNCGSECVLTLKGTALTVDQAQLADYKDKDKSKPTPPITFSLDGQDISLVDTFSPSRTVLAAARWVNDAIEIATGGDAYISRSQRLTIEGKHLTVTTTTLVVSKPEPGIMVLKYERK